MKQKILISLMCVMLMIALLFLNDLMVYIFLAFIVGIIFIIIYKFYGEKTLLVFLLILIPLIFYFLENSVFYSNSIAKSTMFYLELIFIFTVFIYSNIRKKTHKTNILPKESLLIIGILVVNFISFIIYGYQIKIFITTSIFYFKYFLLSLTIINLDIKFIELKSFLKLYSIIIIANTIAILCQVILGSEFILYKEYLSKAIESGYYTFERFGVIRLYGIFPWPTQMGLFSAICFVMYYFVSKNTKNKYLFFIAGLSLINTLFSQGRLAIILLFLLICIDNLKNKKFIIIGCTLLLIFSIFTSNLIFEKLNNLVDESISEYSNVDKVARIYYMIKGFEIFNDNLVFGIGLDRFATESNDILDNYAIAKKYKIVKFDFVKTTDNFIAKILPEFGIVGSVFLIWFFILLFNKSIKIKKTDKNFMFLFYILLFYLAYSINSAHLMFTKNTGPVFWLVVGIIINEFEDFNYKSDVKLQIITDAK